MRAPYSPTSSISSGSQDQSRARAKGADRSGVGWPGLRPMPVLEMAVTSLCFRGRGVKKQGVSGPKNGRLFSCVSAVRFKKTAKPAVPQDRSGLCSKCGTASANRVLRSGAASATRPRSDQPLVDEPSFGLETQFECSIDDKRPFDKARQCPIHLDASRYCSPVLSHARSSSTPAMALTLASILRGATVACKAAQRGG